MPPKCGKCSADIKQGDLVAKCTDCSSEFHPTCTPLGTQSSTKNKLKTFKCENCVLESVSSASQRSNESSAAVDKRTLLEALNSFKVDITKHTDTAVGSVLSKLDTLNSEIKTLNDKFNKLEESQNSLEGRCDTLEQANSALGDEVRSLQDRLNDAEQHSRCANIEIVGIPVSNNENVYHILKMLAGAIGVEYRREDVSLAHRLRLFSKKHAHPPIIAQFVSRSTKEQWIAAARERKNLKSTDLSANLQPSDVYVNNQLTALNKALLGRARRMQRDSVIHYAGYFNGKILVKRREKDAAVRISRLEDLDKYVEKAA